MTKTRIIIMAKAPEPGYAKTRLIPVLGKDGAAALANMLLLHAVCQASTANSHSLELCVAPAPEESVWQSFNFSSDVIWSAQSGGDLGERMAAACKHYLMQGEAVFLMGTDCPELTAGQLNEAIAALDNNNSQVNAVIIPAMDGGYTLLGLRKFHPSLFSDMPWSTAKVFAETIARLKILDWPVTVLPALHDIDEPEDLGYLPADWDFSAR